MYSIGKKEFDMMGKMQVRYKNRRTLYEMQEMAVMYVQDGGALEGNERVNDMRKTGEKYSALDRPEVLQTPATNTHMIGQCSDFLPTLRSSEQ
jgi:hypothetical protein